MSSIWLIRSVGDNETYGWATSEEEANAYASSLTTGRTSYVVREVNNERMFRNIERLQQGQIIWFCRVNRGDFGAWDFLVEPCITQGGTNRQIGPASAIVRLWAATKEEATEKFKEDFNRFLHIMDESYSRQRAARGITGSGGIGAARMWTETATAEYDREHPTEDL